jgi:predicted ABC-type ATPase
MMSESRQGDVIAGGKPKVVVLAGPNGAGKSTAAERLLRGPLRVDEFVNADVIAQGLSGLAPESAAFEASAIMLRRLHALAERRVSFAFETTFASRSLAPWLRTLVASGILVATEPRGGDRPGKGSREPWRARRAGKHDS